MKKKILAILVALVLLLLAAGVFIGYMYDSAGYESVPAVSVWALGTVLFPDSYEWNAAVLGGLIYKEFLPEHEHSALYFGDVRGVDGRIKTPEGYDASFVLERDGELVASGGIEQWHEELFEKPGEYYLSVRIDKPKEKRKSYGYFEFYKKFTVPPPDPEFFTGRASLSQGEIFVMKLENVPDGVKPAAKTDLGLSVFVDEGDGEWFAAVPVGNTRKPGKYSVEASAGDFDWKAEVSVTAYDFDTQNLIVDTSNPVITEASSAKAYAQYREKIPPLYNTFDDEMYWEGAFVWPVNGRISTEFGSIRYTNSNWSNPRYHWGVDIAAEAGTPVAAPNSGRVVFAEYLLNTGNTVAIEHGGGFKSYYFHMSAIFVAAGDMVQKGDVIGEVGSTGYSTGPHLHFETRIGDQAVNPVMLFDGSASLYAFDLLAE
ncbi:MAG: M23 family metallopeptidase [Clostridiales bacterium]|nr:M23 family metallopeptidase [Clostridiales bacterium]